VPVLTLWLNFMAPTIYTLLPILKPYHKINISGRENRMLEKDPCILLHPCSLQDEKWLDMWATPTGLELGCSFCAYSTMEHKFKKYQVLDNIYKSPKKNLKKLGHRRQSTSKSSSNMGNPCNTTSDNFNF
jgi:hypothetical protein